MAFDKSGVNKMPLQIMDLCLRATERKDLIVGAKRSDPSPGNGKSLRGGKRIIHSLNVGIYPDRIRNHCIFHQKPLFHWKKDEAMTLLYHICTADFKT